MAAASDERAAAAASSSAAPPQPPPKTKWPDAAPVPGEELIFSISCGNTHLHWATHFGEVEDYNPQIFWRTPHLKSEDMEDETLLAILSRNLPDDPHDHIFGKSADATAEDAVLQSEKRAVPLISVYVVSTNQGQEALLARIWKTVPSRFFVMKGEDFFKKEEGLYDTMGTDRLATLTGAVQLHGHPALVFDGGTATTYSATDCDGKIMGGGIGPGIQSKFRSLTKDTDALPEITADEVIARVNEAQKGRPLPTFARNTQEAMMADAFQEFALKGRNVIQHWLDKAYRRADDDAAETANVNTKRRVICTGGDGDILMQLLQPHYGGVIEHVESGSPKASDGSSSTPPRYAVETSRHLIHYGVACVLLAKVNLRKRREEFGRNPHVEHVGRRVAKHFEVEADDGDNIFRGKVTKVVDVEGGSGGHEFRIQYDDGDSEDVSVDELFDMFKMFEDHGEKKSKKAVPGKGKKNSQKKGAAPKEKKKEKPQATAPKEIATPQTASDGENTEKAESSDEKKTRDVPIGPAKPAKSIVNGAPSGAKKPEAKRAVTAPNTETKRSPAKKARTANDAETKKPAAKKSDAKKPASKRAKSSANDIAASVNSSDPQSFVRKRIAKNFDGEIYFGSIMEYDDTEPPPYWHVEYDDGDEEDFSKKDLIKALKLYLTKGKNDAKAKS